MMAWTQRHRVRRTLAAVLFLALCSAGGCLSRGAVQKQRYGIKLEREAGATGPGSGVVRIAIVRAAPAAERKSFIYRNSELTYVSDFYHEFFSAPGVTLRENLLVWIDESGIFEYVVTASDTNPDWILESRLQTLYGDGRDKEQMSTLARLQFTLLDAGQPSRPIVFQRTYERTVELAERSPEEYVRGVELVLTRIFSEFEVDLRSVVEEHTASAASAMADQAEGPR